MMVENVVGRFSLPLGIGANFLIDGRDYLIPMAVEEPSVVAGASSAALLARAGGGFTTGSTDPVMIAQIQLLDVADACKAKRAILASQEKILDCADTSPSLSRLGAGPQGIEVRYLPDTEAGPMLIVHLLIDCRDAMGANAANTAAEAAAPLIEQISGGRAGLRIPIVLRPTIRASSTVWTQCFWQPGTTGVRWKRGPMPGRRVTVSTGRSPTGTCTAAGTLRLCTAAWSYRWQWER